MKRWLSIVAMIGLASAPASAGLFTTALSDADAHQIKRLAVVSTLGDIVHGQVEGLTAFQNKSFTAPAPDWGLDAAVTKLLQEDIVASGRIDGEITPLEVPSPKTSAIIAAAREQGFDAVLALQPQEDPHDRLVGPGPTLLHRKLPGFPAKTIACNGMSVYMYRTVDRREIGHAIAFSCPNNYSTIVWHDSWGEFSEEEKHVALDALKAFVEQQADEALVTLKMHGR
jgi:hypothetical protein